LDQAREQLRRLSISTLPNSRNRCGGRRVVLAFLIERSAVKAILEHLRLPTTGPPVAPARGSPQMELVPWQEVPDDSPQSQ